MKMGKLFYYGDGVNYLHLWYQQISNKVSLIIFHIHYVIPKNCLEGKIHIKIINLYT